MCAIRVLTPKTIRDDERRRPAQIFAVYQRCLVWSAALTRKAAEHLSTARAADDLPPVYPCHDRPVQHFVE